jgi:hypothetical protein
MRRLQSAGGRSSPGRGVLEQNRDLVDLLKTL